MSAALWQCAWCRQTPEDDEPVTPKTDKAALFLAQWLRLYPDAPEPEAEYRFDAGRRWRADWAWADKRVLVEVDGGQWCKRGGRHNTDGDREKMNEAVALGWKVLRFSPDMLEADPFTCCGQVARALGIEVRE